MNEVYKDVQIESTQEGPRMSQRGAKRIERLERLEPLERLEQGAHFFAMSATLPNVLKTVWVETLGRVPLEIHADNETLKQFTRHTLHLLEADLTADIILDRIVSRYQQNEAVLVVATTVARAQKLFEALWARVGNDAVWLLHSRFTAEDRAKKEQLLGARLGTGLRAQGDPATILVATQVVEVRLDVDFDVLFTDPAPIEALVQRFGRTELIEQGVPGAAK